MAAAKRVKRPVPFTTRAKRGLAAIDEFVAYLLDRDCPNCGHKSLTIEDPSLNTGIIIYCERVFCRWKPRIFLGK